MANFFLKLSAYDLEYLKECFILVFSKVVEVVIIELTLYPLLYVWPVQTDAGSLLTLEKLEEGL